MPQGWVSGQAFGAALPFASGVRNETEFLVETQDDHTQIYFLPNLHDCCPHYTTEKHTQVTTWQKSSEESEIPPRGQGSQALKPPVCRGLRGAEVNPGPLPQTRHSQGRGLTDSARGEHTEPHAACSASSDRPGWFREAPAPACPPGQPLPQPPLLAGTAGPACPPGRTTSPKIHCERAAHTLPGGQAAAVHPGTCSSPSQPAARGP